MIIYVFWEEKAALTEIEKQERKKFVGGMESL